LRVLVELGASVPTRGLYFVMEQMDELDAVVDAWAEVNLPLIARALAR
jgi:FMN reductase